MIFIYFKNYVVATALLKSAGSLLLCWIVATCQPRSSLLCDHCSDKIVATSHLPIAIVGYTSLVQMHIVVVFKKKMG
jgi:hypothetical protein